MDFDHFQYCVLAGWSELSLERYWEWCLQANDPTREATWTHEVWPGRLHFDSHPPHDVICKLISAFKCDSYISAAWTANGAEECLSWLPWGKDHFHSYLQIWPWQRQLGYEVSPIPEDGLCVEYSKSINLKLKFLQWKVQNASLVWSDLMAWAQCGPVVLQESYDLQVEWSQASEQHFRDWSEWFPVLARLLSHSSP